MDGVGQCAVSDSDSLCHSVWLLVLSLSPPPQLYRQASRVIDSSLQEKWEKSFCDFGSSSNRRVLPAAVELDLNIAAFAV